VRRTHPCLPFCPPTTLQKQHKGWQNEGAQGVVVYLPAGRFKINQTLEITQSNIVLRGAGVSGCSLMQYFELGRGVARHKTTTDGHGPTSDDD